MLSSCNVSLTAQPMTLAATAVVSGTNQIVSKVSRLFFWEKLYEIIFQIVLVNSTVLKGVQTVTIKSVNARLVFNNNCPSKL